MALNKFKYVGRDRVENLLKQQQIRFTQPDALNDPFEMKRFRERHIQETMPALWMAPVTATGLIMDQITEHPTAMPVDAAIRARNEILESSVKFIAGMLGTSMPYRKEEILDKQKQAYEFIDKMDRYGILSMTQHPDNLLMWAHYANEHRGVVFEIDLENEAFCADFTKGSVPYTDKNADEWRGDVQYRKKRATPPTSYEDFIASLFLKSPQWSYEAEYRIVRPVERGRKIPATEGTSHDIYLFPLPACCIKRLIFGVRSDNDFRNHIASIISRNPEELGHIELSQAQLRQDAYGLEITPFTAL